MGNSQSSSDRPNRLSKPKTNTNSPNPALVTDSPTSVSSRYADLSAKGRQQIRETLLSPTDSEFGSTAWTNKTEDVVGDMAPQTRGRPSSIVSRSNSRVNSRSNSMSCFGSKHGSTTKLNELHGSKISLVSQNQVDLDAAIRLLQEVKKNASPEDLAALHEALQSSEDATSATETGLSRRTSIINRSSSSLTRRRSLLQTPGVATRSSPVEGRRRTWNSWKAPKVTPEVEAKWATPPKGIAPPSRIMAPGLAMDDGNTPTRAQTPGELDYGHLGSLKLGTLSIVNGAPSPAPSAKNMMPKSRLGGGDYFAAVDSGSSPLTMKTTRRGHFKSKSSVLPVTGPLFKDERTLYPDQKIEPASNKLHVSQEQNLYDQAEVEPVRSFRVTNKSSDTLGHDASRFAQDYQAYIPDSPFANNNTFSHVDDTEAFTSGGATTCKEETARILTGTIFDAPTTAIEASGSALFSTMPQKAADEKQKQSRQRPAPRTSDSGYSSGGSLRVSESSQTIRDMTPSSAQFDTPIATPVEISRPGLPRYYTSKHDSSHCGTRDLMPIATQLATRSTRTSTSDSLLSPTSPRSVASKESFDSTSSVNQKRLQRRRSAHPEPPVVQSCQSIPEGVPEIPHNVRATFTRRLSNTPGMECLTHTYESKDHVITTQSAVDTTSNVPAEAFTQLIQLEPERPATPPPHGRRKSFSLFRRKSMVGDKHVNHEEDNALTGVVDLGTIASSLGSSPYDAAMSHPLRSPMISPTHPHQLGAKLPRAKSMVGMDSMAAAEFARVHSRDRALHLPEMPQQRRKSHHNLKMEAGEAKAAKRRPQSLLQDIPPVPLIDSSKIDVPQSARPRLEHDTEERKLDMGFGSRASAQTQRKAVGPRGQNRQSLPQHKVDWESHSDLWQQRRKSIGVRTQATFSEASASTINSRNTRQPREDLAAWGRFSGGLDYNYEGRAAGIGGSAGTRQLHSAASSKSLKWRNQYGVDLSDVPIMLQRA
ncbi:hypothetical protein FB567DRAFT_147348 [Paraphoma chrysanthemicola]|uniref:Uncharacterized protein n=1 Tax=Paraphoma chrysanthemicola TaxID=798071 RepID=A0A8K0QXM0_9PLEO|nr:hypothetical protein FB567DRAFT_147348 [Paraphoma chrysanthemicola]